MQGKCLFIVVRTLTHAASWGNALAVHVQGNESKEKKKEKYFITIA